MTFCLLAARMRRFALFFVQVIYPESGYLFRILLMRSADIYSHLLFSDYSTKK
jgi:hypothetical protein